MTQAKIAKRLEVSDNDLGRVDAELRAPVDSGGAVVAVRFDKDDFEKVAKFAEAEGIPLDALIRDATVEKVVYETEKAKLHKEWTEAARLRREQEIRLPSIWDVPNDDDMDEWLREE